MTYKQAYDKIIDAYFKDEIKPTEPMFCFCGTLCSNNSDWFGLPLEKHYDFAGYKGRDFVRMETELFNTIYEQVGGAHIEIFPEGTPEYEDLLFAGMSAALDVLKQIHIERGEVIDETPVFTKRQLA